MLTYKLIGPDGRTIKDIDDSLDLMGYPIEEQAKMLGLKPGDICTFLIGGFTFHTKKLLYNGTTFEELPNDNE